LRPVSSGAHGSPGSGGVIAISFALLRDRPPTLGDADLPPDPRHVAVVDSAVADLAGGLGVDAARELAHAGIRYVLVPARADGGLAARLDAAGGLLPKATDSGWRVWQVQGDAGRLAIVAADGDDRTLPDTIGAVGRDTTPIAVPPSSQPRLLTLAEAPSPQWRAVVVRPDSQDAGPLPATTRGGLQAFVLPDAGADIVVVRTPDRRADWLVFELVVLIVVVGAAIPGGRRDAARRRPPRDVTAAIPGDAPTAVGASA
jgi:hypothetical protein